MEGRHKSAVGEVAEHLEQCRKLQKALAESEDKRGIAEKSGKISESTLEAIRFVDLYTYVMFVAARFSVTIVLRTQGRLGVKKHVGFILN